MPRSPSPTDSLVGPSRSNSVVRQYEKKPYERPSSSNLTNVALPAATAVPNGLLGGLKRSLSRWFSSPVPELPAAVKETPDQGDRSSTRQPQRRPERAETPKRQAPQMSPERGTPSKKQRIISPSRLEVQGRAVESFNVKEYGNSRLPTKTSNGIPNYARPFGADKVADKGGMSRSQTTGAYNDPPLALLASPASRQQTPKGPLSGGMKRSETMTLNLDRSASQRRGHLASPLLSSSSSLKSPLYSASGLSRSSTAGNLSATGSGSVSMGRISSPASMRGGQQEAAERAARQRSIREGSFVPASPSRHGLRSSSRMEVDSYRTRDAGSPAPRGESPRRSMSTVPFPRSGSARDVSMIPASPSREVSRSSRLRYSARPMVDEDDEEVLMGEAEEEMDVDVEEERYASRRRGTSAARMSVDVEKKRAASESMDQSIKAETLLEQLAEMRKASRHSNVQAGRPSSVQAAPVPASLSTRQLRKRMAVKVPKASTPAEELKLISSLSEGPARLRGTRMAKEFEMDKNKAGSVMQRPYARKASGSGKVFEQEFLTAPLHEREESSDDESEDRMKTDEKEKPFTFSMANAPTKVSGPMNIQFSPSATKIVRSGPSTLRAQTTKTNRKHEPAATRKVVDSRPNQFALPDDDDDDDNDEGMQDDEDEIELERQPSKSPQPVSIPPPVRSPSPRNKKDVDVTAVRKARGFLDAAGINRPRASSPLAGTPLNASTLVKPVAVREKPSLNIASPVVAKANPVVPDFFAMPKNAANASTSVAPTGKGSPSIGLGRPGAASAPSFAFTAPSPTSSPSLKTERDKPAPAFSFDAPSSTTPTKPPPFVFSAPSAGSESSTTPAAVPDFFAKPATVVSQPVEPSTTSAAPPSFFGNVGPPSVPSTGSFSFGATKPLPKLFGSSEATTASTSTPVATPAHEQSKPAEAPPAAPSASGFKFGTTSSTSVPATGGLFGSVKAATPSSNTLFGGNSSGNSAPSANPRLAEPTNNSSQTPSTMFGAPSASKGFSFSGSSTPANGSSTPAAAPATVPAFSFGAPASKNTATAAAAAPAPASAPAPSPASASTASFKFGSSTNTPFGQAPTNPIITPNSGGQSTPSAAPPAFNFGSTSSTAKPASSPFTFGSSSDSPARASSPAPFVFGAAPATSAAASSPFGNPQSASTGLPSASPFGSSASAPTGMFGSNPVGNGPASATPSFAGFGQTTSASAAPAPSPFGQPSAPAPSATPAGGFGGFGAPAQSATPTGMFGATSTGFGASNGPQPGMFGSAPGTPGTPGTANTSSGFNFSMGAAGPAFPAGPDASRQPSPAFSVGAGDASGGRKIRKMPTARKK